VSHALGGYERPRRRRVGAPSLTLLELLVLAPLSLWIGLWWAPDAFDVEWGCAGALTTQSTRGELYGELAAVAGSLGWLVVFVAFLFAHIAEQSQLAAALPTAWFAVYAGGCVVAAAAVGPALCP